MAAAEEGIHVLAVHASNFHRLTFAEARVVPGVGLVRVTGKNGSGKTSLLRGIRSVLGGAKQVLPEALHEGTESGVYRILLSNGFVVERQDHDEGGSGAGGS